MRISVDLPDCGPPTTIMWPAAPEKSRYSTSRRCSNGLSIRPSGTTSPPGRVYPSACSPRSALGASAGSSWSSGGAWSSGGSHTWCAGTPCPSSRPTITSSTVSASASSSREDCAARYAGSGAAYTTGTGAAVNSAGRRSTGNSPTDRSGPPER